MKSATAQQPETTTMFDLLWKFYEKSGQYVAAAKILNKLADRHSTDLRWSFYFLYWTTIMSKYEDIVLQFGRPHILLVPCDNVRQVKRGSWGASASP